MHYSSGARSNVNGIQRQTANNGQPRALSKSWAILRSGCIIVDFIIVAS